MQGHPGAEQGKCVWKGILQDGCSELQQQRAALMHACKDACRTTSKGSCAVFGQDLSAFGLLQVAEELRIERDSAGSGASFATDAGGLEAGQKIERSSKSLSALKPVWQQILSLCTVRSDMLF